MCLSTPGSWPLSGVHSTLCSAHCCCWLCDRVVWLPVWQPETGDNSLFGCNGIPNHQIWLPSAVVYSQSAFLQLSLINEDYERSWLTAALMEWYFILWYHLWLFSEKGRIGCAESRLMLIWNTWRQTIPRLQLAGPEHVVSHTTAQYFNCLATYYNHTQLEV